jgi:excisionase family DNA binding protein
MEAHQIGRSAQVLPPRLLLTVEDAARALSISRTSMFALIKSGQVVSVKVGVLRRVPADALTTYITELTRAHNAA